MGSCSTMEMISSLPRAKRKRINPPQRPADHRSLLTGKRVKKQHPIKIEDEEEEIEAASNNFEKTPQIITEKLLQQKKLILLLDLDHTLLHAVDSMDLSSKEYHVWRNLNKTLFKWEDYIVKLRPYVHTFLLEAYQLFDMYICTRGSRAYAHRMVQALDPLGVYFNSKIITREDFEEEKAKDLNLVLGEEKIVVILDDTAEVWRKHIRNLVPISKYNYFAGIQALHKEVRADSLCEMKKDEEDDYGTLALTLFVLQRIHSLFFASKSCEDVRHVIKFAIDRYFKKSNK